MKKHLYAPLIFLFCVGFAAAQEDSIGQGSGDDGTAASRFKFSSWVSDANLWRGARKARNFELGFVNADLAILNSQVSAFDLFKSGFEFDVSKMKDDFSFDLNILSKPVYAKFHFGSLFDMEIFTGFETRAYGKLNGSTLDAIDDLINFRDGMVIPSVLDKDTLLDIESLVESLVGSINASAHAFAEIGVAGSKTLLNERLWFRVAPSLFFTLLYMPESDLSLYKYGNKNSKFKGVASSSRTPISMYSSFPLSSGDMSEMFSAPGFDLALEVRTAIFPVLDIGGAVNHIPIIPSTLRYRSGLDLNVDISVPNRNYPDWQEEIKNGTFNYKPVFTSEIKFHDSVPYSKQVMRPTRFDLYALLKPFSSQIFVIKPMVGFSINTVVAGGYNFNWEINVELNLPAFLSITAGLGLREEIYHQNLALALDFRIFELDLGISLQGTTFENSWEGRGIGAVLGLKFGY